VSAGDRERPGGPVAALARAAGVLLAVSATLFAVHALLHRQQTGFVVMSDFFDLAVYRAGGEAVLDGTPLYRARLEGVFSFTYPPFAALLFVPLALGPAALWQALVFPAGLAMLAGTVALALRSVAPALRPARTAAVVVALTALLFWLEPVSWTLYLGQVNLALMLLVLADLTGRRGGAARERWRGVGLGIATGIKLTPALFIVHLLVTRQFRAAATAAGTAAGTVAVSLLLARSDTLDYWGGTFLESERVGEVASQMNQSVHGTVARLSGAAEPSLLLWLPFALLTAFGGLAVAAAAHRRGMPVLGLTLCGLTGAAVSPISWSHHWVWFVPLVVIVLCTVRIPARGGRAAALVVFCLLLFAWPLHFFTGHRMDAPPLGIVALPPWHGLELLYGNAYLLCYAAVLAGAAVALRSPASRGAPEEVRGG
jgi:alpha-1,2-mannosyltransferase